jgi:hydroxyacylglutathione hydrolase
VFRFDQTGGDANRGYALVLDQGVTVVDPLNATEWLSLIEEHGWQVRNILLTHEHWDHTAGVAELLANLGPLNVYAHKAFPQEGVIQPVEDGQEIPGTHGLVRVLATPGHTPLSVSYYVSLPTPVLLSGDTLFLGGCGNARSGSVDQLFESLMRISQTLPGETEILPGHHYGMNNYRFVAWQRIVPVDSDRLAGLLTDCPCSRTLAEELTTNPFLQLAAQGDRQGFKSLRAARDQW